MAKSEKQVKTRKQASKRIIELDLLRGFLILAIIINHLQFWPSPFTYLTGRGKLWVTAAEGFFIISGLLIGYLRAHKDRGQPLKAISKKLFKRALTLYLWGTAITVVIALFIIVFKINNPLLPSQPFYMPQSLADIWHFVSGEYFNNWVYFLRLYAIVLVATPAFLWLIRKNLWWVAALISLSLCLLASTLSLKESALGWQLFFFTAALIGWKMDDIIAWFKKRPAIKKTVAYGLITITFVTIIISSYFNLGWKYVETENPLFYDFDNFIKARKAIAPWISSRPLTLGRVGLSFIWFGGLLSLFYVLSKYIQKFFGWILLPFGQRSLSTYCLHAIVLTLIISIIPISSNPIYNGIVSLGVLLLCLGLIKVPFIAKILPK